MLRRFLLLLPVLLLTTLASAQTLDELKAKKAELQATIAEKQGEIGALEGEIAGVQKEINILSGWITGVNGIIGFSLNQSNNWVSNPNPDAQSTSLNFGITAFANQEGRKHFWRNKLLINKSWQDIDLDDSEDDNLFDNGTIDLLNLSSLVGYKLNDWFALSGLAELNTSLGNFLDPGSFDIGVGATLTPVENLVIVIHPFNYHFAFSGIDGLESTGAFGAKVRADYTKSFKINGKPFLWSSTFTTFFPYKNKKMMVTLNAGTPQEKTFETGLFEYTWLNTVSFQVWKGIGVGLSGGLRQADFEFDGTQSFYSIGLTYNF